MVASTREVEWDETEQNWMLALQEYRDSLCSLCGWPTTICQDPKHANQIKAKLPVRCYAATSVAVAQEREAEMPTKPQQPNARLWGAEFHPI